MPKPAPKYEAVDANRATALIKAARRVVVSSSTADLMSYAKIRSDDPENPGAVPFQVWPAQQERFASWDAKTSEVILKARQLGFSWSLAGLALRRAMYEGAVVGIFSVGQKEAREQLKRIKYLYDSLPDYLTDPADFRSDDAEFQSGGKVICFPSTEQAGISYTFQLVIMDEAGFHPYAFANYAALRPTLSAGGQIIINSTANPALGRHGFFHDIYWQSKNGETGYNAVFVPWHSRPDRDEAWLAREKAAYTGMPEHFDAYYPDDDIAAFIGRAGLVYDTFDPSVHVVSEHPFQLDECVRVVAGIDFGGGDPTAVEIWGMNKDQHVHNFAEFYKRGAVGIDEIAQFLARFKPDSVMCDPSQTVAIETLRKMGFNAKKANNRRGEGFGIVKFLLENKRMTHHVSCSGTINEYSGYRWSERVDPNSKERYATSTPVDHHGDGKDADRYSLVEIMSQLLKPQRIRSYSGRPLAKVAV